MPAFILKAIVSYLESHPQVIEQLIAELVTYLIGLIKAANTSKPVA